MSSFNPGRARAVVASRPALGRGFRFLLGAVVAIVAGAAALQYYGLRFFGWGAPARAGVPVAASEAALHVAPAPVEKPERAPALPPPEEKKPDAKPAAALRQGPTRQPPDLRVSADLGDYRPAKERPYAMNGIVRNPYPGCALYPGQTVELVTEDTIVSEVQGPVSGHVAASVYPRDDPFARTPLIPAGARVVGKYRLTEMTPDRRRLDLAWEWVELPGGVMGRLGDAAGLDFAGSAGYEADVRQTHWGDLFLGAAIMTMIGAAEYGSDNMAAQTAGLSGAVASSAGREGGQIARQWADKALSFAPTLKINKGARMMLRVPDKYINLCAR